VWAVTIFIREKGEWGMKKIIPVLLLGNLFAYGLQSQEAPQVFRDWRYERKDMGDVLGNVCVAYTEKKLGDNVWRLSILFAPNKENPTHVVLSTQDATLENSVVYSQTDSSTTIQKHYRSEFLDLAFGNKSYWFAPSSFVNFYKYIRRGSSLKVKYVQETEKQLYFSLMGSTAATNRIAELCNNKKEFVPEAFYDYVDKVNVAAIPTTNGATLSNAWDDLGAAWDSYLESGVHQAALTELQKQIDPLVAKQREFLRQSGLLTTEIQNQEKTKADLEAQVLTQKAQLKKAQEDLAAQDSKLQSALVVLKDKEDIFRPVREEGRPYFSAVDAAKQRVSTLNTQIANSQEQIRQTKLKISALWNDVSTLENRIRAQQQQLSQLKTERIRANSAYNSYNVETEHQRLLNTDAYYVQRLRAKEASDRELPRLRNALNSAEAALRNSERELRSCQAQQPPQDCSVQEREVNQNRNEVSRSQREYDSELATNDRLEREVAERKRALRRVVEDEKQALAKRVTDLDIDINETESAMSQNEFRLNTLRNSDIPRAERELSSAENTLLIQQGQLDTARDNLRRSEQDLASFKARTAYDRKESEYLAADKEVRSIRTVMLTLDTQIKTLQSSIAKNEARIVSIAAQIERLINQLAATQTELQNIQAALAPLMQQKEGLAALLAKAQAALKVSAEEYRVSLRDLPLQKMRAPVFPQKFHDWL